MKVYIRPQCPYSQKLITWLKKKRIKAEILDLTEESKYRDQQLQKTGQMSTPTIQIKDKFIIGFKPKEIEKLLH